MLTLAVCGVSCMSVVMQSQTPARFEGWEECKESGPPPPPVPPQQHDERKVRKRKWVYTVVGRHASICVHGRRCM
eukprot:46257-Eustigmatos_ZCMA.PRE.1